MLREDLTVPTDVAQRAIDQQLKHLAAIGDFETKRLVEYKIDSFDPDNLYHGGYPGLNSGDIILPPSVTGYVAPQTIVRDLSEYMGKDLRELGSHWQMMATPTYDRDYVYLTHSRAVAADHAASWSNWNFILTGKREPGMLYTTVPYGPSIDDYAFPVCCCLTHGNDRTCAVKTTSAIVVTVCQEVWPIVTPGWNRITDQLKTFYGLWRRIKDV